jgi:hypothetical protein
MADSKDNTPPREMTMEERKREAEKERAATKPGAPTDAEKERALLDAEYRQVVFQQSTDQDPYGDRGVRLQALQMAFGAKWVDSRPEYILPFARAIANFVKTGKMPPRSFYDDPAGENEADRG